jgi:hypothetical protein
MSDSVGTITWTIELHSRRRGYHEKFRQALEAAFPGRAETAGGAHHIFRIATTDRDDVTKSVQDAVQALISTALAENKRRHVIVVLTRSDQPRITTQITFKP